MNMERDYVYVDKRLAERMAAFDVIGEGKEDAINEFIEKIREETRRDYQTTLESMEEDAALYAGLMLKVKKSFEKTKNESLSAHYQMWEQYDSERESIRRKVEGVVKELQPITRELEKISELMQRVNTYPFSKLVEAMSAMNGLYGEGKEMFEFLVKHFGEQNDGEK